MANALSGILQGAGNLLQGTGNVAKDIYGGVRDWGRRYTYGPYYEENRDIAMQQALARIESEKAHQEYWRSGGAKGGDQTKSNDTSYARGQAIYNKAIAGQNAYELTGEGDPKIVEQFERQKKVGQDMMNRYPLAEPKASSGMDIVAESFGGVNGQDDSTISVADKKARAALIENGMAENDEQAATMVMDAVGKMPGFSRQRTPVTGQPPQGALGNISGPQISPQKNQVDLAGINKTIETLNSMKAESAGNPEAVKQIDNLINGAYAMSRNAGAQAQPMPPQGRSMNDIAMQAQKFLEPMSEPGAGEIPVKPATQLKFQRAGSFGGGYVPAPVTPTKTTAPKSQPKTTNEIDFYMPKLDKPSQDELNHIMKTGNKELINKALQMLRDKYGVVK
jgi:hypothetical protein